VEDFMKKQMSDTIIIAILLAIIGGFLDAYTYSCRGQVFANAQTGNIVLLGIQLVQGNLEKALYYICPILAFFLGIIIAETIHYHFLKYAKIHWRQIVLLIEVIVLMVVAFLSSKTYDVLCNIMVSFVCALQVETFRKFNGYPYASTMCTGNLRSATEYLYQYISTKDKKTLIKSLQYYMIIFFFILGACLGVIFTNLWGILSSFVPVIFLIVVIGVMFIGQTE